jgi:2-phosphosulfolactate phosphatase
MNIQLLLTPHPLERAELEDKTVVVIDVLRSSTTICASLLAGARAVIPTAGPGEAGELRAKLGGEATVLAGERNGVKIENFQYGNSPADFVPETVGGKSVILCTTNGTGVFDHVVRAGQVLCGALVNISTVAQAIAEQKKDAVIVCSGREGGFSIEDTLCGGMLIDMLRQKHGCDLTLNDAGTVARLLYRDRQSSLKEAISQGEHGRFLTKLGMSADVDLCSRIDIMPVLPVLKDGRLVRADAV